MYPGQQALHPIEIAKIAVYSNSMVYNISYNSTEDSYSNRVKVLINYMNMYVVPLHI